MKYNLSLEEYYILAEMLQLRDSYDHKSVCIKIFEKYSFFFSMLGSDFAAKSKRKLRNHLKNKSLRFDKDKGVILISLPADNIGINTKEYIVAFSFMQDDILNHYHTKNNVYRHESIDSTYKKVLNILFITKR